MINKNFEEDLKTMPEDEDDDQNFIQKDEPEEENSVEKNEEVQGVIDKLKNIFSPKNNQQRNLTREVGGLEVKQDKGISEDDIWDKRSEEVDAMAQNVFNSSGMRSVVWRKKREKLEAAKQALEAAAVGAALTGKVKTQDAATPPTQGYVSRLKNLQQDRSTIRGDEMSR